MARRQPLGLLPFRMWYEGHPDQSLPELLARYIDVLAAVNRYRAAGLPVSPEWLVELGVAIPRYMY